ncbi:hypothetical protein I4F81_001787 [Pyropia yezoensis]|uniref:Uncharacterized protein n=1 Tax=Pyropia yezoensis TaxID=2788 RepID=A0ACC3BN91_PYRYE|nr:hypothetical protein I4F81_001787 [Neopyropia yezoensis]
MYLLKEEKKSPKECRPVRVVRAKDVNRTLLENPEQRKRDKPGMSVEQAGSQQYISHLDEPAGVQGSPGRGVWSVGHEPTTPKSNKVANPRGHTARHLVLTPPGGINRVVLQPVLGGEALDLPLLRTGKYAMPPTMPGLCQRSAQEVSSSALPNGR